VRKVFKNEKEQNQGGFISRVCAEIHESSRSIWKHSRSYL